MTDTTPSEPSEPLDSGRLHELAQEVRDGVVDVVAGVGEALDNIAAVIDQLQVKFDEIQARLDAGDTDS